MKKILVILLLFCFAKTFGQSESNNPITYDTTFNSSFGSIKFIIRITRQANDTTSRPAIITGPGQGEMNHGITDTTQLSVWGPHFYIKQGWDGSVVLGNGIHYPMLITIVPYNTQFPSRESYYDCLNMLLNTYHIKRTAVHVAGLSQSAFCWTDMISYEATVGDHIGMKNVTSLTALSGFALTNAADSTKYKTWSTLFDGRYFGTEGYNDVTRNTWKGAQYINSVKPGTAYFSYNTIASGGHGGWNIEYDPTNIDWRTDPSSTKGPFYSPSQPPPFGAGGVDKQCNYSNPSSLFQWMLRQGDSSLVIPAITPDVTKVLTAEYRSAFITKDSLFKAYVNASSTVQTFPLPGGKKVIDGVGGFNSFFVIAADGTIYKNFNDLTTNWTQIATDSSGASINNATFIDAMADTYIYIDNLGQIRYGGTDTLHLSHSVGAVNMRPIIISPSGIIFKKALVGFFRIVGLSSTGQVYEWLRNSGSIIASIKTIPRPAIDIFTSHYDMGGCIIPNATGSQTAGYPYVWGNEPRAWFGTTSFTQPTSVTALWNVVAPIKVISSNWNAIHYIDTITNMYAAAYNSNGELGNGTEFANQYNYIAPYSWPLDDFTNSSGVPFKQVGIGVSWSKLWSNVFFVYYKFAQDISGNLWYDGRDKAMTSGRGFINNNELNYPNALDVPIWTKVTPLTSVRKALNFQLPNIGAGSNQTLTNNFTTLTATGHPALLINAANSSDTVFYTPASYLWTKVSGTGGTIVSPTSKTTSITGLSNGVYTYQVLVTDNNGGTDTGQVKLTVALNAISPSVGAGNDTSTVNSSITITGTALGNNGATITSTTWILISGPNNPTIVSPNSLITNITGLIIGTYVFQLSATDSNNQTSTDQMQVVVNSLTPIFNGIILNKGHIKRFIRF